MCSGRMSTIEVGKICRNAVGECRWTVLVGMVVIFLGFCSETSLGNAEAANGKASTNYRKGDKSLRAPKDAQI